MVEMDVLRDPKAFDKVALRGLKVRVEALMRECVRPWAAEMGGGVVAVGPKKVLGVTIRPARGLGGLGRSGKEVMAVM